MRHHKQWLYVIAVLSILLTVMIIPHASALPTQIAKQVGGAMVTISMDDGGSGIFEYGFPILQKAGIPATVFVNVNGLQLPDHISLDQLIILQNAGWEIGSHTMTHSHMTQLNSSQVIYELQESKKFLMDQGISVSTLAYPFSDYNSSIQKEALKYYDVTRSGVAVLEPYLFSKPIPEEGLINSTSIRNVSIAEVESWIDSAIADGTWVNIMWHNINQNGTIDDGGQNLSEIAGYIGSKIQMGQLRAVTFIEGWREYQDYRTNAPRIISKPTDSVQELGTYRYHVESNQSVTWSLGTNAKFVSIDQNGNLIGNPGLGDSGSYRIRLIAENAEGKATIQDYSLVVKPYFEFGFGADPFALLSCCLLVSRLMIPSSSMVSRKAIWGLNIVTVVVLLFFMLDVILMINRT